MLASPPRATPAASMSATLATWITVPLIGGAIGYVTNWLAVKMIFRPIRPISLLGLRVQGLIGRRQQELAASIGRVVGDHLVAHEDVVRCLAKIDFEALLANVLDEAMRPKLDELRALPLIGGFLTPERVATLRASLVGAVVQHRSRILLHLETAVEEGLDVQTLVTQKVAAFPVEKVERLILEVAAKELRAIVWLGGLLGLLIGLGQVLVVQATA